MMTDHFHTQGLIGHCASSLTRETTSSVPRGCPAERSG